MSRTDLLALSLVAAVCAWCAWDIWSLPRPRAESAEERAMRRAMDVYRPDADRR